MLGVFLYKKSGLVLLRVLSCWYKGLLCHSGKNQPVFTTTEFADGSEVQITMPRRQTRVQRRARLITDPLSLYSRRIQHAVKRKQDLQLAWKPWQDLDQPNKRHHIPTKFRQMLSARFLFFLLESVPSLKITLKDGPFPKIITQKIPRNRRLVHSPTSASCKAKKNSSICSSNS